MPVLCRTNAKIFFACGEPGASLGVLNCYCARAGHSQAVPLLSSGACFEASLVRGCRALKDLMVLTQKAFSVRFLHSTCLA